MKRNLLRRTAQVMLSLSLAVGSLTMPQVTLPTYAAVQQTESIYIAPIDRAKFLAGAYFDFRVELNNWNHLPESVSITINGQDAAQFFGKPFVKTNEHSNSAEYTIRQVYFEKPGKYTVKVVAGNKERTIHYDVVETSQTGPKAKNVIFFVVDGMTHPLITATRIMSKGISEGKYHGLLEVDTMDYTGVVTTSGMDSIATDSANSASAYNTGHKTVINALGVYPDNTADTLDDPKVETIFEMLKRATNKSLGIVTNTELQDATPAAAFAHTRRRADKPEITEMLFHLKPDVILGGGSAYFLPQSVLGSKRSDDKDFIQMFEDAGYHIVENRDQLLQAKSADKVLGLFHMGNMNTYIDRAMNNTKVLGDFTNQPTLWEMTETAIDILSKNDEGFYLYIESGNVDKQLHPLDWERAVYDMIEFDKALGVAKRFAERHGDTLIVVTADHGHSMSITGTYWEGDGKKGRDAVRVYQDAGFPTYVDSNGDGFPDHPDTERKLAVHFANSPDYYNDHRFNDVPTAPAILGETDRYVANPATLKNPNDNPEQYFIQGTLPYSASQGVHTVDDVPLKAHGIGADKFNGVLDNTEIFFAIVEAMGLQLPNAKY